MKIAKLLKRLSVLCFLLLWVPFAVIMIKRPFSAAIWGPEQASQDISGGFFSGLAVWIALTVALGIGSAVFLILSLIAGGFANIQIMAHGNDAEARILSIERTGTTVNDNPLIDIVLQVMPKTAPAFTGRARKMVSILDLPSVQPGQTVHVRYVPGKEQVAIMDAKDRDMLKAKGLIRD